MGALQEGAGLLLGALLACAAVLKLTNPMAFMRAVRRLLPHRAGWAPLAATLAAPLVGTAELATGIGAGATPWLAAPVARAAAVAAALLAGGFVVVVGVAIRKGASCGCWSSFSDATAGGAELARAIWLSVLALGLLATDLALGPPARWHPLAFAWLALLAVGLVGATLLGRKLLPAEGSVIEPAPAAARAPVAELGRALAGRVTCTRLETVGTLDGDERAGVVAAVLATPSGGALQSWLEERGLEARWDRAVVQETSVEKDGGGSTRQVVVAPPADGRLDLQVAATLEGGGLAGDAIFLGTLDGETLAAAGGMVVYSGSIVPTVGRDDRAAGEERARQAAPHSSPS